MAHSILEDLSEQTFTESTIKRMFELINRAKTDAEFQKLIYGLVNRAMPGQWKDYKRELSTVFNWFKKNIDYRRDPYGVELLQDVWSTLDRKRADCDDATTFMAAVAEILGSPARIVTVSTRSNKEPNHVYAEALVGGRWQGLDATVPHSYVGWAPPHVTARRIWTRKELGLSGGEDEEGIEGLGMSHENGKGYGNDGFGTDMRPVSRFLAPGVRDDVSKTYAPPAPGDTFTSDRKIWRAPIANVSDWTSNPRPGGGVYGPALPIKGRPLPQDLWYLVDRKFAPKVLDPDAAWWGKVPTSREDLNRMFPGSEGTMDNYLRNVASVPASAIDEVTNDVRTQLAMGEIGQDDVPDAIGEALENYALGLPPRMKLPKSQRPPRTKVKKGGKPKTKPVQRMPYPAPLAERRYMVPGPRNVLALIQGGHLNGLGQLGDAITDAAKVISDQIVSGTLPKDAATVNQAVTSAVNAITGGTPKMSTAETRAVSAATITKNALPIGMVALLGAAAWLISMGSNGSRRYKSNPRRRSGRGRRRSGGGGFDIKTALLWGGGGLAAYFLLLRPGGFLTPATPRPVATVDPRFPGVTPAQQAQIAAGVKAAPGIFDSIIKLFSGGSTPAPAPAPSGFVTSYDQFVSPTAPTPAPESSGFTMNYT